MSERKMLEGLLEEHAEAVRMFDAEGDTADSRARMRDACAAIRVHVEEATTERDAAVTKLALSEEAKEVGWMSLVEAAFKTGFKVAAHRRPVAQISVMANGAWREFVGRIKERNKAAEPVDA